MDQQTENKNPYKISFAHRNFALRTRRVNFALIWSVSARNTYP